MDKVQLETLFANLKESINAVSIDKIELNKWKKENRNLFLQFVPSLKDVLLQLNLYINEIEPELNTDFTQEIAEEIINLKDNTEETLSHKKTNLHLEIITERKNISENINYQDYESDELIDLIEEYLKELKSRKIKWEDKKEDIIKRIEEDKNNLRITENEIKNSLIELTEQRNNYLKNKKVLEIHFQNNQNNLSFKSSIEDDIKDISEKLKNLDEKLKVILVREQDLVERNTNNPYTFE